MSNVTIGREPHCGNYEYGA